MNEAIRRPEQVSPKSSPLGSRSPAYRTDSSGTLKTTISLGKNPSVKGPFYLIKDASAGATSSAEVTGSHNLMSHFGLEHSYSKFCKKEGKEELSAFLPNLPGYIDSPAGLNDGSSLRSLIEKPPVVNKEIAQLSNSALTGFRLYPGPLPEQYRFMNQMPKKKPKPKRKRDEKLPPPDNQDNPGDMNAHIAKKEKKPKDEKEKKKKKKKNKKKGKEKEDAEWSACF